MRPAWGINETHNIHKKGTTMSKHRATGNPRGRPPKIPYNLDWLILCSLKRRVDPKTGLVQPDWRGMAREFGVSRSTIARQMVSVYASGAIERVTIPVTPKVSRVYYRLR